NIQRLKDDGVHFIDPDQGEMACGTFGPGRLSEPDRIVSAALEILRERADRSTNKAKVPGGSAQLGNRGEDLKGEHFLITAGATREPIDPVRFISNRSSGR